MVGSCLRRNKRGSKAPRLFMSAPRRRTLDAPVASGDSENFGDEQSPSNVRKNEIHPDQRLGLAKNILSGLGLLAAFGIFTGLLYPIIAFTWIGTGDDSVKTKDFFDHGALAINFVTVVLPPIPTLVIGYYFGQNTTK